MGTMKISELLISQGFEVSFTSDPQLGNASQKYVKGETVYHQPEEHKEVFLYEHKDLEELVEIKFVTTAISPEWVLFNVLLNKAKNVRMLQKKYFKTRSADVLKECKEAEQDLDRVIEQIEKPKLF